MSRKDEVVRNLGSSSNQASREAVRNRILYDISVTLAMMYDLLSDAVREEAEDDS